jgi:hypothetical protein
LSTSQAYESTKQQAQEAGQQIRASTQRAGGQAQEKLREQIDVRTTQAGERVSSTASELRSVGQQLREQGNEAPARIADTAADRVEQLGGYLKEVDSERLVKDLESFARQRPWVVAVGGLALGFVASRLLKVSSSERFRASQVGQGPSSGGEVPSYAATPEPYERTTDAPDPLVAPVGVEVARTPEPETVEVDDLTEPRSSYSPESPAGVYSEPLSEEEEGTEGRRADVARSPRSPGL